MTLPSDHAPNGTITNVAKFSKLTIVTRVQANKPVPTMLVRHCLQPILDKSLQFGLSYVQVTRDGRLTGRFSRRQKIHNWSLVGTYLLIIAFTMYVKVTIVYPKFIKALILLDVNDLVCTFGFYAYEVYAKNHCPDDRASKLIKKLELIDLLLSPFHHFNNIIVYEILNWYVKVNDFNYVTALMAFVGFGLYTDTTIVTSTFFYKIYCLYILFLPSLNLETLLLMIIHRIYTFNRLVRSALIDDLQVNDTDMAFWLDGRGDGKKRLVKYLLNVHSLLVSCVDLISDVFGTFLFSYFVLVLPVLLPLMNVTIKFNFGLPALVLIYSITIFELILLTAITITCTVVENSIRKVIEIVNDHLLVRDDEKTSLHIDKELSRVQRMFAQRSITVHTAFFQMKVTVIFQFFAILVSYITVMLQFEGEKVTD